MGSDGPKPKTYYLECVDHKYRWASFRVKGSEAKNVGMAYMAYDDEMRKRYGREKYAG